MKVKIKIRNQTIKSEEGTISIMMVVFMSIIVLAFALYSEFLSNQLTDNAVRRAAFGANRNVKASYKAELYGGYGILAYEKEQAEHEVELSLHAALEKEGEGMIPFGPSQKLKYTLEKKSSLADLGTLLDQTVEQCLYHIPMSLIISFEKKSGLLDKARRAREQVQRQTKLLKGLELLGNLNRKLGDAIDKIGDWDKRLYVRVSSRGVLKIRVKGLQQTISTMEDCIPRLIKGKKDMEEKIKSEKIHLTKMADELPEGFVESSLENLDASFEGMFSNRLWVDIDDYLGEDIESQIDENEKKIRANWTNFCGQSDTLERVMENQARGLAGLQVTKKLVEEFKDNMDSDYGEDLWDIKNNRGTREAYLDRKDLEREIKDQLEDLLSDVSVSSQSIDYEVDKKKKAYVDKIKKSSLSSGEDLDIPDPEPLSSAVISQVAYQNLPSRYIEGPVIASNSVKGLNHIVLTEYLMGTFNHRLTETWHEQSVPGNWDFYGKKNRNAFFKAGELEYIIAGGASESGNRFSVAARIYITREIFNFIHVYTDTEKKALADTLSLAVAWQPWLVPVVKHGILIGWASAESFVDVQKLLAGEAIPTIKFTDDDWFTSVDPEKIPESIQGKIVEKQRENEEKRKDGDEKQIKKKMKKGKKQLGPPSMENDGEKKKKDPKTFEKNEQNYSFYLRLYLTKMSSEIRLKRMLDIISLNDESGKEFDPRKHWTGHKLTLTWSKGSESFEEGY